MHAHHKIRRNMINKLQKRAFTLIELLVVIAIIGILASLIIVSLSGARGKAQDTQRKNNARNLDTALSQFYLDSNNAYPSAAGTGAAGGIDIGTTSTCTAPLGAALVGADRYLTSATACGDPAATPLAHRYFTDTTGANNATRYTIAWLLSSQSENVTATGNGIYQAATGGVLTIPSGTPNIAAATTTLTAFGTSKVFAVYGPQ